jgi:putative addiction module component (TIGR02574 family)
MKVTIDDLINDIMTLPVEKRSYLAEKILESLDAEFDNPISDEWLAEIKKRCQEIDTGAVELTDADTVFSNAYSRFS